jgi:hypothetical protein
MVIAVPNQTDRVIDSVTELMKHPSTATAAALYQRSVNVDRLKYLPLKHSSFYSN